MHPYFPLPPSSTSPPPPPLRLFFDTAHFPPSINIHEQIQVKENAGDISELREALEAVEGRADEDHKLDLASEAIDEELEELRSRVENRRSFFSEVLEEGEESLDAAMQRAVRF